MITKQITEFTDLELAGILSQTVKQLEATKVQLATIEQELQRRLKITK